MALDNKLVLLFALVSSFNRVPDDELTNPDFEYSLKWSDKKFSNLPLSSLPILPITVSDF